MRIRFYGTRGSIATPGLATVKYGGNTSCVEVTTKSGTRILIDAGTGAAVLGRELQQQKAGTSGCILISHTHWDHISGIPFFSPLFVPGNEWRIFGPRGLNQSVAQILAGQMQYTYFPINLEQVGSRIVYYDLVEGSFEFNDVVIAAKYLNHPALTLGYRLHADGVTLVYACDHEPYSPAAVDGSSPLVGEDRRHVAFVENADLLIHDAQYVAQEYEQKRGWGHSTWEYATAVAQAGNVRRLALMHHDPTRSDSAIDSLLASLKPSPVKVFAAAEGLQFEIEAERQPLTGLDSSALMFHGALKERTILLSLQQPDLEKISEVARLDDFKVLTAAVSEVAAAAVRYQPELIVLDDDSAAAAAAVRKLPYYGEDVPILLVSRQLDQPHHESLFTDFIGYPYTPQYARTKLRTWMIRTTSREGREGAYQPL